MSPGHPEGQRHDDRQRRRDPDQTGPVTSDIVSNAASRRGTDAGTGPVPVAPRSPRPADPGSVTAPHPIPGQSSPLPGRAAAPPTPPQRPGPVPPPRRPGRKASRDQRVVAFVLHQFPIGHMPVAATEPSRQLPAPEGPGTRMHPESGIVSEAGWAQRVRAGAARGCPHTRGETVPGQLTEGYRQHGDLGELEWERAFRTRSATVWPEAAPAAEPVVLPPDTVVDHLGDGFGRMLAPVGTPFAQRGMPPETLGLFYRRFRLLRPVPMWRSVATSWFAQPGGGLRYQTTCPVVELIALGYLLELTEEANTLRLNKADGPREEAR